MDNSTKHTGSSITLGVILMVLGLITLGAQAFTTLASVLFLGWMLILGGIVEFVYGFFSGGFGRAIVYFLAGIVTFFMGLVITTNPQISAVNLTVLIGIYMLVVGGYKAIASLFAKQNNWGWNVASGVILFVLGWMILGHWPASGLYVIGLFIGIELFILGFSLTVGASRSNYEVADYQTSAYISGAKGGRAETDKDNEQNDNQDNK
jgi:uncharacterized membrane protein HdeD (DUF308 family)